MTAATEGGVDIAALGTQLQRLDRLVEQDGVMFPWALHVLRKKNP